MSVAAVEGWRSVVGAEHVATDPVDLEEAESATFSTSQRIVAIVRPANVEQVQACVKVANEYRTPIYSISRGRNWGLGSRVPVRTGCALLDLGRLNRIIDYDEKLATITVQPGVTFGQVNEFLRERKSPHFATATGGPPDGSFVGNALERGEGVGPYGDRSAHVCGLEVVLPSGDVIRTGFGRFANATTARLSQVGVGPSLDGLFIQSNFGIVTELTSWLYPLPRYLDKFAVAVADTSGLAAVVDAIQPLVLQATIPSHSFGLWNAYKIMAVKGRYPWRAVNERTPLRLRDMAGREPWSAVGALYSVSAAQRTAGRRLVEAALKGLPGAITFESVKVTADTLDPWLGLPTARNLRSMYWRKKNDPVGFLSPFNPHRHRCGVMWLHPTLPFDGRHVVHAAELMASITAAHGFEPLIGMSCPSGRLFNVYLALVYDRDVAGEDERAATCHDALMERLIAGGYPPYRLGVQSMRSLPASGSAYENTLRSLKTTLDPNSILAPGRYELDGTPTAPKRVELDPSAALRALTAHRETFGVRDSVPLTQFIDMVAEARGCTIESSCKVEGGRLYPARFNLWFQEPPAAHQLQAALRFFHHVEVSEGVVLDDALLRRFCTEDFDWRRTEAFVVGVDLREMKRDMRLKVWFKLGEYPEKVEDAFRLPLPSEARATLRALVVRAGLLVGFDFHLDGRAAVKLYSRIEKTDLLHEPTRARLVKVLPPHALTRMDSCLWSYISVASDDGERILHFCPVDPDCFISGVIGPKGTDILKRRGREDLLGIVVSVREKHLLQPRIADFNLYFMCGAPAAMEGSGKHR
jgi:4-cresol dehydrogenase (hydroxylating)